MSPDVDISDQTGPAGPVWLFSPDPLAPVGSAGFVPPLLREVLVESRRRGLLGPATVESHVAHAAGFAMALPRGSDVVDMGSGGGVPGLVLVVARPDLRVTLLDAARRRCQFLQWALDHLEARSRAAVVHARAEDLSRMQEHREAHDAVVARLFGPPAVTAECARALVRPSGVVVVSEPPSSDEVSADGSEEERWPPSGLAAMGLTSEGDLHGPSGSCRVLRATGRCGDAIPRRAGMPSRRPRF